MKRILAVIAMFVACVYGMGSAQAVEPNDLYVGGEYCFLQPAAQVVKPIALTSEGDTCQNGQCASVTTSGLPVTMQQGSCANGQCSTTTISTGPANWTQSTEQESRRSRRGSFSSRRAKGGCTSCGG